VTDRAAPASPVTARARAADPWWDWGVGLSLLLLVVRLAAIRLSPLQLDASEAEYWRWSRDVALGHFGNPPLIGWIVRATTALGDTEALVRLASPLLQAAAGLFLFATARRLYDSRTAFFSLLVYELAPAVQLGSFLLSPDTPLIACLAAALLAYVAMQAAEGRGRLQAAAALGATLGLAFLASYAALGAVVGIALHLALSASGRRAWTWRTVALAVGAFAVLVAPHLIWTLSHGLAPPGQMAGGAIAAARVFGAQFGVFGPLSFAVLIGGAVWLIARRGLEPRDGLLLAWATPPLVIALARAAIAGAGAEAAITAFAPGAILVAAWMLRWNRPRLLTGFLAAQAVAAFALLVAITSPGIVDHLGLGEVLNSVRGGREQAQLIEGRAKLEALAAPLSAVAIDDRGLFDTAAYYGRDYFGQAGAPPLKAWRPGPAPRDEAERAAPLTPANGARVLAVSKDGVHTRIMRSQFQVVGDAEIGDLWLGRQQHRRLEMFVGQGFTGPGRPPRSGG
jgi:hypothetical protein